MDDKTEQQKAFWQNARTNSWDRMKAAKEDSYFERKNQELLKKLAESKGKGNPEEK